MASLMNIRNFNLHIKLKKISWTSSRIANIFGVARTLSCGEFIDMAKLIYGCQINGNCSSYIFIRCTRKIAPHHESFSITDESLLVVYKKRVISTFFTFFHIFSHFSTFFVPTTTFPKQLLQITL